MLEIILAVLLGIGFGIAAGLLPGFHPNNTIPLVFGLSFIFDPQQMAFMLITCGIVNGFVAFVPAVLLGAPEDSTAMSILPGHKLLLKGRGYEAIRLCVIGGLGAIGIVVITLPVFAVIIPNVYSLFKPNMHLILGTIVCYMISTDKKPVIALSVFILSGLLGYSALALDSNFILPLLTGLFGMSTLITSLRERNSFPDSFSFEYENLSPLFILSNAGLGSIAGILAGLFPGLGSAQATVIAQEFSKKDRSEKRFLISNGSIVVSDLIYSLLALWLIGNPRSGIANAVGSIVTVDFNFVISCILLIIASAGIGAYLTLKMSRTALFWMRKINYRNLCLYVMAFLIGMVVLLTGIEGLAVLGVSTAVGLYTNLSGVRRSHAMGCLMLPTILFFAGISF